MTQNEWLDYLVEQFKKDSGDYADLRVGNGGEEKRRVLRSLMNIRLPRELDDKTLRVQDEYLRERAAEKGVVTVADIPARITLYIVKPGLDYARRVIVSWKSRDIRNLQERPR